MTVDDLVDKLKRLQARGWGDAEVKIDLEADWGDQFLDVEFCGVNADKKRDAVVLYLAGEWWGF